MTNEEEAVDRSTLETALASIAANEVRLPHIPIDKFVQEAYDLHHLIVEDHEPLLKAGMSPDLITELSDRARLLRRTQSMWSKERYSKEEAAREWDARSESAYELKDSLEASFRFAFRKHPNLLAKVAAIEEGTGHVDMVQDLSDLSVLGKANLHLLEAINLDLEELNTAEVWADELAILLARVNGERQDHSGTKHLRDKAYTYLKEVVDEIRATARFVYRKNPKKLVSFQRSRK